MGSHRQGVSRRCLLASAGLVVTACVLSSPRRARAADPTVLRARPGTATLRGRGAPATDILGYDGTVPGPLLRVRRGQELKVRLINELPEPTSIHWHGVRVPNAMDGVPLLTRPPVSPGGSFDYRFSPPDAGTFWYHPGFGAARQVGRGLAGLLIVDEPERVDVDHDVALLLDEWKLDPEGRHVTVNGEPAFDIAVKTNERLRLRLVNGAYGRLLSLRLDRHAATVMAIDGEPAEPIPARGGRVTLGPGNRIDLFADAGLEAGATANLVLEQPSGERPIARLVYGPGPGRPAPRPPAKPLPANPLPERMSFAQALRREILLEAGVKNELGGSALFSVKRGRTVMLALGNRTAATFSLHLHGHHFRLLDNLDDGWKPFWLDTLPVPPRQTLRIAFVADNPGKWLIHAHALDDEPHGYAAFFEVA